MKRLTVLNPGKSEEGFYECRATNTNSGQIVSRKANLTIIGTYLQVLIIILLLNYKDLMPTNVMELFNKWLLSSVTRVKSEGFGLF